MNSEIRIPMEVTYDIGEIYFHYGIEKYYTGDICYYNPDHDMYQFLMEKGFFKPIDNDKCTFYCNDVILDLDGHRYNYDDEIDIKKISEEALESLLLTGMIRKEVNDGKLVKNTNSKTSKKKKTSYKYSNIARALNISFKEVREKARMLDIELKKASDKISKKKMNEIIEAIK